MQGVSINGPGTGIAIELNGTNSILASTISGFGTALTNATNSNLTIGSSNFLNNASFHVVNNSTNNIAATGNWWGTNDVAKINDLIVDKQDDINKGEVLYSPLLMTENGDSNYVPVVTNSITPLLGEVPLQVSFTSSATDPDGSINRYQWDFNGDKKYDFTSMINGDSVFTYIKGGYYVTESRITDDRELSNRLFYKIAVIDFNSKSEVIDENKILVNWGWGNYYTVVIEAPALRFLSDGDMINIYDYIGYSSSDCGCSDTRGKVLVASQTYSAGNDSVYVFNCQPSINLCSFNSSMKSGFGIGDQMHFEILNASGSYEINPTEVKAGSTVFADSAFTSISKFEVMSLRSAIQSKTIARMAKAVGNRNLTYSIYRNGLPYKLGVTDLYIIDQDVVSNADYRYDIYLINNGTQVLSKSTSVQNKLVNILNPETNFNVEIYPNPAKERLMISTNGPLNRALITVYDIYGKKMISQPLDGHQTIIDINSLMNGVYLLKLTNDEQIVVRKFIKQ